MSVLYETTQLNFLQWQDIYNTEKPFELMTDIPADAPDQRRTNLVFHSVGEQKIRDVRGVEDRYSLDAHGFAYRTAPFPFAESLLRGRVRIINLWRPFYHTVEDRPLTVYDGSTVEETDLIKTDHVQRNDVRDNVLATQ
ncbi:MAG: hypothetical protein M1833_007304 [Piccolia ochrophora]|nr:MAG: hypothetical protein M1833_007304 [Piccolia ochrophora]